ncbi:MAG: ATP synthase F1 subunit gamma [Chitinophagales bacterium]
MSGQLKEIKTRIKSVSTTQQITKAMKLVSASKLRRAQDRIVKMRPYALKLNEILANIAEAAEGDVNIEYAKQRPAEKILAVILTSDRGLCGAFNNNAGKLITELMEEKYGEQYAAGNVTVMYIGKKGFEIFKKNSTLNHLKDYIDTFNDLSFENVSNVAEYVMNAFVNKEYDRVEVAYHRFKNQMIQIAELEQFLPIQKLEAEVTGKEGEKKMKPDFTFEPNKEQLIEELAPKILKTQFYRYLLENNASEHGARMTAMAKATDNAEELINDLKVVYNRARQTAITTQIVEIVSGAAALQSE